jgi:hypothetical protein
VTSLKSHALPITACLILLTACVLKDDDSSVASEILFQRSATGFWYLAWQTISSSGITTHDTLARTPDSAREIAWFSNTGFRTCSKDGSFHCIYRDTRPLSVISLAALGFSFLDTATLCRVTIDYDSLRHKTEKTQYYFRAPGDTAMAAWQPLLTDP